MAIGFWKAFFSYGDGVVGSELIDFGFGSLEEKLFFGLLHHHLLHADLITIYNDL